MKIIYNDDKEKYLFLIKKQEKIKHKKLSNNTLLRKINLNIEKIKKYSGEEFKENNNNTNKNNKSIVKEKKISICSIKNNNIERSDNFSLDHIMPYSIKSYSFYFLEEDNNKSNLESLLFYN